MRTKTFRVRGKDIKSGQTVGFDAMEGRSAEEVTARLNAAGIAVESVIEVERTEESGVGAGLKAAAASIRADLNESARRDERRRAARRAEDEAMASPRQRVLADLTFSAQLNIAAGVAIGVIVATVVLGVCGGVIGVMAGVAGR